MPQPSNSENAMCRSARDSCQKDIEIYAPPKTLAATTATINPKENEKSIPPTPRRRQGEDLIVAWVGDTGTGKSSLIRAMMGNTGAGKSWLDTMGNEDVMIGTDPTQLTYFQKATKSPITDILYADCEGYIDSQQWISSKTADIIGSSSSIDMWTPHTPKIAEWLPGDNGNPLFWIRGKPGCGKSTLAKYVCDNYLAKDLGFCFFPYSLKSTGPNLGRLLASLASGLVLNGTLKSSNSGLDFDCCSDVNFNHSQTPIPLHEFWKWRLLALQEVLLLEHANGLQRNQGGKIVWVRTVRSDPGDEKDGQERNVDAHKDYFNENHKTLARKCLHDVVFACSKHRDWHKSDIAAVTRHAKLDTTIDLRKLKLVKEPSHEKLNAAERWKRYLVSFNNKREASFAAHSLELSNDRPFGASSNPARLIEDKPIEWGRGWNEVRDAFEFLYRMRPGILPDARVLALSWSLSCEVSENCSEATQNSKRPRGDRGRDGASNNPWSQPARLNPDDDDNDDHFGFRRANFWEEPQTPDSGGEEQRSSWYCCRCPYCDQKDDGIVPASGQGKAWEGTPVSASTIAMWKAAIERTCTQNSRVRTAKEWSSVSATDSWGADHAWSANQLVLCH